MISNTKFAELIENSISFFENSNPTKRILLTEYADKSDFISASIYTDLNIILLIFKDENLVIDFSSILSYNIKDDTETVSSGTSSISETKTNTGSLIGRSLAGAAIAGGVGAIIGGSTATKSTSCFTSGESSTTNHNYTLYLNINCLSRPSIKISFGKFADALYDFSSLLNVIIKGNDDKHNHTQVDDINHIGKIYDSLKYDIIIDEKKKEKLKQQKQDKEIKDFIENENRIIRKNPIKIFKYLFRPKDLITLSALPLGFLCSFTFTFGLDWWMFFSYILFLVVSIIIMGIGLNCDDAAQEKEKKIRNNPDLVLDTFRESYYVGYFSAILIFLMVIGLYPIFLSFRDLVYNLNVLGLEYSCYEGGLIVYLLVLLFEGVCGYLIYSFFKDERNLKQPEKSFFRYKLGLKTGIVLSVFVLLIMFFGIGLYSSYNIRERKKYIKILEGSYNSTNKESDKIQSDNVFYKYHNKITGEG